MNVQLVGGQFAATIELDEKKKSELPDVLVCRSNVRYGRKHVGILKQEYKLQRPVTEVPMYKYP